MYIEIKVIFDVKKCIKPGLEELFICSVLLWPLPFPAPKWMQMNVIYGTFRVYSPVTRASREACHKS